MSYDYDYDGDKGKFFEDCQKLRKPKNVVEEEDDDNGLNGHTVDPYTIEETFVTVRLRNPNSSKTQLKARFEDAMLDRGCSVEESEEISKKIFNNKYPIDDEDEDEE